MTCSLLVQTIVHYFELVQSEKENSDWFSQQYSTSPNFAFLTAKELLVFFFYQEWIASILIISRLKGAIIINTLYKQLFSPINYIGEFLVSFFFCWLNTTTCMDVPATFKKQKLNQHFSNTCMLVHLNWVLSIVLSTK